MMSIVQRRTRVNTILQFRREITQEKEEGHVFLISSSCNHLWFAPVIMPKLRPFTGDDPDCEDSADATADDCKGHHKKLGDDPRFHLSELRSSLEEDLVYAGHAPAYVIGRLKLADRIPDDRADGIRSANHHESDYCQEEGV